MVIFTDHHLKLIQKHRASNGTEYHKCYVQTQTHTHLIKVLFLAISQLLTVGTSR